MPNYQENFTSFYTKYKEEVTKHSKEIKASFNFGLLPMVMTTAISILIPIIIFLIVAFIPQGKHIILSNISTKDPFVTTVLIGMYCFLTLWLYQVAKQRYIARNKQKFNSEYKEDWFNKSYDRFTGYLFVMLPLYIWITYLSIKYAFDEGLFPFAFVTSLVLIVLIILTHWRGLSGHGDKFTTPLLGKFLLIFLLIIFGYHLYIYELSESSFLNIESNGDATRCFDNIGLCILRFISLAVFIVGVYVFDQIKKWHFVWYIPIQLFCAAVLISIGSIRSLDILLLFAIVLRLVLFIIRLLLTFSFNMIFLPSILKIEENGYMRHIIPKKRWVKIVVGSLILGSVMLLTMIFFIGGHSNQRDQYDFKKVKKRAIKNTVTSSYKDFPSFNKHAEQWIKNRQSDNDPIYLVAGQGGGSRAGCAFLYSMLVLAEVFDNDLMAMTTISGSSNGAGMYLGIKKVMPTMEFDTLSAKTVVNTIYQKDFISRSLFKLLFSDPFKSWFYDNYRTRNNSLILQENQAYNLALDSLTNLVAKTTSYGGFKYQMNFVDSTTIEGGQSNIFAKNFFDFTWQSVYESNEEYYDLPVFIPVTFNLTKSMKSISTPYALEGESLSSFHQLTQGENINNLTIGESIALSEMFPIISASGVVDSSSFIDGGVYDNGPFETLHDIYNVVSKIRDTIASHKKIILVSVENSYFRPDTSMLATSELGATINAAASSIFTSSPLEHLRVLKQDYEAKNDTMIHIKSYGNIDDDKDIVLSRLLNKNDINRIAENIKRQEKSFDNNRSKYVLYFDYGKSTISKESRILLSNIKTDILQADSIKLKAFCDKEGDEELNRGVLIERGRSIKKYLLNLRGAAFEKSIEIINHDDWKGKASFMIDRMRDKRVEMYIFKKKEPLN